MISGGKIKQNEIRDIHDSNINSLPDFESQLIQGS